MTYAIGVGLLAFGGSIALLLALDYVVGFYDWARRWIRFWGVKLYAYYVLWQVRRKLKSLGITLPTQLPTPPRAPQEGTK